MDLKKYFLYWLGGMLGVVVLFIVFGTKVKKIDLKSINFYSTESAELYFKNIRSFSYEREENEEARFILYRIKTREKDTLVPTINFMLVSNWLQDENYIIAEPWPNELLNLGIMWQSKDSSGVIELNNKDVESNYIFAATFYEQLAAESKFYYLNDDGVKQELIFSEDQRKSLNKTLKDYFKLVGKIR